MRGSGRPAASADEGIRKPRLFLSTPETLRCTLPILNSCRFQHSFSHVHLGKYFWCCSALRQFGLCTSPSWKLLRTVRSDSPRGTFGQALRGDASRAFDENATASVAGPAVLRTALRDPKESAKAPPHAAGWTRRVPLGRQSGSEALGPWTLPAGPAPSRAPGMG